MENYTKLRVQKNNPLFNFLLICLLFFHAIANATWLILNKVPPTWDAAQHTAITMRFVDFFQHHLLSFDWKTLLTITPYYPPLVHLVGVLFGIIAPYNITAIQLTGTLFFLLTIYIVYKSVSDLFQNNVIGFFSAFFFSFLITVVGESRGHMTDIPLTFFIVLTTYTFYKSRLLQNSAYAIFFFLSLAATIMTRWTGPIYLIIPFILIALNEKRTHLKISIIRKNLLVGAVLLTIICLPWYLTNLPVIQSIGKFYAAGEADDPKIILSATNLFYYFKLTTMFQFHFVGLIFGFLALILMLRDDTKKGLLMISEIVFAYLFFTLFIANKNIRFLIPVMPFIATILGYGMYRFLILSRSISGRITSICVLIYFVGAYVILSFGFPLRPTYKKSVNFPIVGWTDIVYLASDPVKLTYDNTEWPTDIVAKVLIDVPQHTDRQSYYFVDTEKAYLNVSNVHDSLYEIAQGVPSYLQEMDTNFNLLTNGKLLFTEEDLRVYVNRIDIAVIPLRDIGPEQAIKDYSARKQIQEYFLKGNATNFRIVKQIPLPDSDTVFVYSKIK